MGRVIKALRVHLERVLRGGGNAKVAVPSILELAMDEIDLILVGAGPQGGDGGRRRREREGNGRQRGRGARPCSSRLEPA